MEGTIMEGRKMPHEAEIRSILKRYVTDDPTILTLNEQLAKEYHSELESKLQDGSVEALVRDFRVEKNEDPNEVVATEKALVGAVINWLLNVDDRHPIN